MFGIILNPINALKNTLLDLIPKTKITLTDRAIEVLKKKNISTKTILNAQKEGLHILVDIIDIDTLKLIIKLCD